MKEDMMMRRKTKRESAKLNDMKRILILTVGLAMLVLTGINFGFAATKGSAGSKK